MKKQNGPKIGLWIAGLIAVMTLILIWNHNRKEDDVRREAVEQSTAFLPPNGWYTFHNVTDSADKDVTYNCIFKALAMRCDGINPSNNQPTALLAHITSRNGATIYYQSGCQNCLENTKETYTFVKKEDGSFQITGKATASYIGREPPKNFKGFDELEITYQGS